MPADHAWAPGLRVRVTTVPLRHGVSVRDAQGVIVGTELVPVEVDGQLIEIPTPVIHLHNGRAVRGYECFWTADTEAD